MTEYYAAIFQFDGPRQTVTIPDDAIVVGMVGTDEWAGVDCLVPADAESAAEVAAGADGGTDSLPACPRCDAAATDVVETAGAVAWYYCGACAHTFNGHGAVVREGAR